MIIEKIDAAHSNVKRNKWLHYFAVFNRIALAAGFLPSGYVKIIGERFTDLSANHPMGNYLEALHHTGYYYTFIGLLQITAAILLLIPRTSLLGALLYFPIILNICVLSFAVRFDGSLLSSPLMVVSNLFLLCWDYDRLKLIFFPHHKTISKADRSREFPFQFFAFAALIVFTIIFIVISAFDMKPYNTLNDCKEQCIDSENPAACEKFCECIHQNGQPLDRCLQEYHESLKQ